MEKLNLLNEKLYQCCFCWFVLIINFLSKTLFKKSIFQRDMKKLLEIIKIQELNACYQLELDFKTERHNLKRYLKSLKQLKSRIKVNQQFFANMTTGSSAILVDQQRMKKKTSELDYYTVNGVKVFKLLNMQSKRIEGFYQNLVHQSKDLIERITKYLEQSKQGFVRVSKEHQKAVKEYSQKCHPQTTTVLYILGFVNAQKVKKIEDKTKQQGIVKEAEIYSKVLNNYLDKMQELETQCKKVFQQYYLPARDLWGECIDFMKHQMGTYQIQQQQIQNYYKQTGGAMTDRSDRSNRQMDNTGGQQEI